MAINKPNYTKEMEKEAAERHLPLVTIDVDDKHTEGTRKGKRQTVQGPLLPDVDQEVRRTLLKVAGVPRGKRARMIKEGKEDKKK